MVPPKNPHSAKDSTSVRPKAAVPSGHTARPLATIENRVQGEGDYQAAREFNKLERTFVASGRVAAAARAAAPKSATEQREMSDAEQKGKQRSKGEDRTTTVPTTRADRPHR